MLLSLWVQSIEFFLHLAALGKHQRPTQLLEEMKQKFWGMHFPWIGSRHQWKRVTIELEGLISASLLPGNTDPFEEMSQRRRAAGDTASDLIGPNFETQASRSRDERVTAQLTRFQKLMVFSVFYLWGARFIQVSLFLLN